MKAWDIIQIFLILAVMVGIMYGLLFLVKKYLYTFDKKGNNSAKVKIISTQALLPKKFVSVIEFNSNIYLLGISEQSVNLLDKFDESNFIQEPIDNSAKPKQNFLNLLKANMGIK
ncbi:MAG: flagellar biosynthetic protein FliO [Ignavibacteriae bacterium]|nr:flagellar biosynthetic protein FliO [Ignavibacteriota bacterium]